MGNLWTSPRVQPVHGTYLEDRPIRPKPLHSRVASFIPLVQPTPVVRISKHRPPTPYKEKARRIFHDLSLRRQALNQGTLLQRRE